MFFVEFSKRSNAMSQTTRYYTHAELSLAAYADLAPGVDPVPALTDSAVGMSLAQADQFSRQWTVIARCTDPASGLSVTVFAPTSDPNARYLAIRGTEPAATDLTADGLLALGLPAVLNPQYVALKARIDQWRNDPAILKDKTFSVSGHSLGGYLAAAVKQQYGSAVTDAYLYNAPGVLGPIGNTLSLFGLTGAKKIGVRPRFKFDNQKLALPPIFVHAQRLFGIRGASPIVLI
jgi:hypothetical protein